MVKGAPDFMRPVIQVMEKKGGAIEIGDVPDLSQVADSANSKGTFGYTTIGATKTFSIADVIAGSLFTSPAGVNYATKITFAVNSATAHGSKMRAALYRHSNLALYAVTEEATIAVPVTSDWRHLYFTDPVLLEPSTDYIIVVWSETAGYTKYLAYDAGATDQGHSVARTYDGIFPNPLPTPTHGTNKFSIYCTYYTGGYQTVKTLNFSTPALPSGVVASKFAVMVTWRIWNTVAVDKTWCRIYVDDVLLFSLSVVSGTATYYETAQDIAAGSHHADINIWGGGTGQVDNARTTCGVGTMSTALVKAVEIVISGDSKALIRVGGKSWSAAPTVTAEVRGDDSTVDKATVSQAVTQGGALYENSAALTTFIYQMLGYYAKSSVSNVPAFLTYSEDKAVKMMML